MKDNQDKKLLEYLEKYQYASIEDLSTHLYVSPSTVRRKLTDLQSKGLITRTHGGAKLNDENNFSPSFTFRIHQNSFAKKKIALSAIKLIKNGDMIFLDGSTSSFFIAEYLSEFKNIRVITNGIDTLSLLAKNGITAYSTGGHVSEQNRSVLVGRYAEQMINNFHADIAFFSTNSLTDDGEIYDCFEEENFLRSTMIKNASKSVFLCDGTKFGKNPLFRLCNLNDVDYIITDQPINHVKGIDKVNKIITD